MPVIHSASAKALVGTISTMRVKTADRGGRRKLAPVRPTTSHSAAQMINDAIMGTLNRPMVMGNQPTLQSIDIVLEPLPDALHGVQVDAVAANPLGITVARDVGLDDG